MIDVQVAFGFDSDIDTRVPREQIEHVVEEANTGRDRRAAGPVEADFNLDVGFLRLALDRALSHAEVLCSRAFYQGFSGFATALRTVCKYGVP